MSSHVHTSDNLSRQQVSPPELSLENELFQKVALSFLPFLEGVNDLSNSTHYLLKNIKAQCDVLADFARESAIDPCAVVEFKTSSLVNLYDGLSNQLDVVNELLELEAVQHAKVMREKEQLQKRLFSMERDLKKSLATNKKYRDEVHKLKSKMVSNPSQGVKA